MADFGVSYNAVIPAGASLSGEVDLGAMRLFGFVIPAGFEGDNLIFEASIDGQDFYPIHDEAGDFRQIEAGASRVITIDAVQWLAIRYLKVRARTGLAADPQTSEVTIQLLVV